MDLKEAIYKRRSVRKYKDIDVKDEDIDLLLQYAMAGPSAHNKKPWFFCVIKNDKIKEQIRSLTRFSNIKAPVYIVVCGDETRSMGNEFWVQDVSAAIENILLGATSLGLGTCWLGVYPLKMPTKSIKLIIEAPQNIIPLGIIALGYPDESPEPRTQYDTTRVKTIK